MSHTMSGGDKLVTAGAHQICCAGYHIVESAHDSGDVRL
jgi:hypothetical protein